MASPINVFSPLVKTGPHIGIIRQSSLAVEQVSKNGIQQRVHVVVKNQPFLLQVALLNNAPLENGMRLDFNRFPVEARLVYDCESLKEVDFLKLKPLDVKSHINERGDQITYEVRLKVLSSQLEDMFFRIRFSLLDPASKMRICNENFVAFSESIKVVSKPEQVKRKKVAASSPVASTPNFGVSYFPPPQPQPKKTPTTSTPTASKSDITDLVGNALQKIESSCNQQSVLLKNIVNTLFTEAPADSVQETINSSSPPSRKRKLEVDQKQKEQIEITTSSPTQMAFEKAFSDFMKSYQSLSHEDLVLKLRAISKKLSNQESEDFSQLINSCVSSSKESPVSTSKNSISTDNSSCACVDCPHRKELENIDQFYNDLLSAPYPSTILS